MPPTDTSELGVDASIDPASHPHNTLTLPFPNPPAILQPLHSLELLHLAVGLR